MAESMDEAEGQPYDDSFPALSSWAGLSPIEIIAIILVVRPPLVRPAHCDSLLDRAQELQV